MHEYIYKKITIKFKKKTRNIFHALVYTVVVHAPMLYVICESRTVLYSTYIGTTNGWNTCTCVKKKKKLNN